NYKYSVAWIDCLAGGKKLGRSIVMFGNHAELTDLKNINDHLRVHHDPKLSVPFQFPSFALNSLLVRTFNLLYYHKNLSAEKKFLSHYETFFYPLDSIHSWNRIYGKKGFLQWQCVLPETNGRDGIKEILTKIQQAKRGSFLAVLKKMGEQEGLLNFPVKGYTLALDFSLTKNVHDFLDRLDEIVIKFGGRIYLTKDARLKRESLAKMYPDLNRWKAIKKETDPENRFSSLQAERLGLLN
ncbi:MAG: D-arabinono-1,4-lactone oxidase, partial [Calditrichaceae bacterium]